MILIFDYGKKKKIQNNGLLKFDSLAKNWSNYENRVVEKNEQQPVEISLNDESPTMVYSLTHEKNKLLKENFWKEN